MVKVVWPQVLALALLISTLICLPAAINLAVGTVFVSVKQSIVGVIIYQALNFIFYWIGFIVQLGILSELYRRTGLSLYPKSKEPEA